MSMIRSTFKRMFLVILAVVLLMPGLIAGQSKAEGTESGWSLVTLEISLNRNKCFAKYGVTVFLDGKQVRHLNQGDLMTVTLLVPYGDHRLSFVPDKDGAKKCSWELCFAHEQYTLECEIQTHRKYVAINAHRVTADARKLTEQEKKSILNWKLKVTDTVPFLDVSAEISVSI